jgi:chromosome segregation ATPase
MEKQIQNDIFQLNQIRKEILDKEEKRGYLLTELEKTENLKIKDVLELKLLREYQRFLNEQLKKVDSELNSLKETEKHILESIKEKNAQKKAIESYISKKSIQQEVKRQFEEAIQNSDNYNRNFVNNLV